MANIGLARGTVRLEPYNPSWQNLFLREAEILRKLLKVQSKSIQHVGSTSIPGVMAKPIVDIAILVDSLDIAEEWAAPLAGIGYWYKGIQLSMPDRRFFAKGPNRNRTVYLHLVNEDEFKRLVKFRDRLRANKELTDEYVQLKEKLALGRENNRVAYSKLKGNFIQRVLSQ